MPDEDNKDKAIQESNAKSAHTNKVLALTCLGIFLFFIIVGGFGAYLTFRGGGSSNSSSQKSSNYLTYTSTEGKYSVQYPKDYTKDEDSSGMGAEFVAPGEKNVLRSYYILANGKTLDQYFNGIKSIAESSLPGLTVTEIDRQNQKLGNLNGEMRVWQYSAGNTSNVEVRIAAISGNNIYSVSMSTDYASYQTNLPLIKKMAESFKLQ